MPTGAAGFAALAEHDPETAWQRFREADPNAILRTLAAIDPPKTLQRLRSVPELVPVNRHSDFDRAALWRTPYGSLFGAWARHAPAEAALAIATLPRNDQVEAANGLALTWACADGPAALRFLLQFNQAGRVNYTTRRIRLDILLRTSLILQPAETAQLLASRTELREAMAHHSHVCLKPWYHADPDGALAWMLESGEAKSYLLIDFANYLFRVDPAALNGFLAKIRTTSGVEMGSILLRIAHLNPAAAHDIAMRHKLALPETFAEKTHRLRIEQRPDLMLADFLQTVTRNALTSHPETWRENGWPPDHLYELAVRVALLLPEQAPALAAIIPAAFLDTNFAKDHRHSSTGHPNAAMLRFWPELSQAVPSRHRPQPQTHDRFPTYQFKRDPLATAEDLLARQPIPESYLAGIVAKLYEIDPDTARAWTARLEPGRTRDAAELQLAGLEIPRVPLSSLRRLQALSHLPADKTAALWRSALQRILHQGGDWKSALAQSPAEVRAHRSHGGFPMLEDFLREEARLRDVLARNSGP